MQCCTNNLQIVPVCVSVYFFSSLLNVFACAVNVFVFIASKFASASIQFKPAVNISE